MLNARIQHRKTALLPKLMFANQRRLALMLHFSASNAMGNTLKRADVPRLFL